ncbi:MAG: VanZ family protein [Lachnospiraceae bacterium]|jgi:VanZ family protein|nr:VanZ family protein [Lachnospiraceae bacterium]
MHNDIQFPQKKRIVITILCGGLLVFLYILIFFFSDQDAEASGSISHYFSEKLVEFANFVNGGHWSDVLVQQFSHYWEHPIRKLAHFSEYMAMGILVFCILHQWVRSNRKSILPIVWVAVSAGFDEFHQSFIPGRVTSVADVLLDTCGGAFGVLLCVLVLRYFIYRIPSLAQD